MSTTTNQPPVTAESVRADLLAFLERRTKQPVAADLDLFASGLVSSMFAMESTTSCWPLVSPNTSTRKFLL